MKSIRHAVGTTALLLASIVLFAPTAESRVIIQKYTVDVCVYGGSAGGVIAAVAAARAGKSVLLIEPGNHVGGMVSGGLGATDVGNGQAIGGYAREFFDRVREHYIKKYGKDSQQVRDCAGGFRFEPHIANSSSTRCSRKPKSASFLSADSPA